MPKPRRRRRTSGRDTRPSGASRFRQRRQHTTTGERHGSAPRWSCLTLRERMRDGHGASVSVWTTQTATTRADGTEVVWRGRDSSEPLSVRESLERSQAGHADLVQVHAVTAWADLEQLLPPDGECGVERVGVPSGHPEAPDRRTRARRGDGCHTDLGCNTDDIYDALTTTLARLPTITLHFGRDNASGVARLVPSRGSGDGAALASMRPGVSA
jgi:hypothetical protein